MESPSIKGGSGTEPRSELQRPDHDLKRTDHTNFDGVRPVIREMLHLTSCTSIDCKSVQRWRYNLKLRAGLTKDLTAFDIASGSSLSPRRGSKPFAWQRIENLATQRMAWR